MTVVNFRAADIYVMYGQRGRYLLYGLCVCVRVCACVYWKGID